MNGNSVLNCRDGFFVLKVNEIYSIILFEQRHDTFEYENDIACS